MTKETFVKRMQLIQNFYEEQEEIRKFISKLTDGFPIVTFGESLVNELINTINEELNIKDNNFLYWWLLEDVEKIIYYKENKLSVKTLDELYDCIVNLKL